MATLQVLVILVILGITTSGVHAEDKCAKCDLRTNSNNDYGQDISGTITLKEEDGTLTLEISATGFNATSGATEHGFHVHATADSTWNCDNMGGHYNPTNNNHSSPNATDRHIGDLGNVQVKADGTISATKTDTVALLTGDNPILGQPIVIHADPDDFVSQPTGAAGVRYACCLIEDDVCDGASAQTPAVFALVSIACTLLAFFNLYCARI